ncbi:hypothetical protein RDV77_06190 [Porphyromonadaceae sp. NP-X]|jgi:hypothetical protein|nr:hypothetical protein [Porphyromonadaceae sp. NP-X]NLJ20505.1 hypothetical protein [Bacteroidales bacterium]
MKKLLLFITFILLFFPLQRILSEDSDSKLIIDMVHHNPGDKRTVTAFTNPQKLIDYHFNGQVVNEFTPPTCAITYDNLNPDIFPIGSKERQWVEDLASRIDDQIADIHAKGLKAYYFTDIIVFPKKLVELYKNEIWNYSTNIIDWTKPKTKEIHRLMLNEIFTRFPNLDGLVIRTGETYTYDIPYHQGNAPADNSNKATAILIHVELMNMLKEIVCEKYGKTIIYRTWDYAFNEEHGYFHTQPDFYLAITNQVDVHPNFFMSIKHTGGDYFRTFPFNKTIGIGKHKQVIEIQCAREYEGKGAYANYIADDVINGYEELQNNPTPKCLNDIKYNALYSGIFTWSRGGGWGGPYLENEFWCDVNAYVLAQWANNSLRQEKDIFKEYALLKGFNAGDAEKLHQIALLSSKAIVRGRASLIYPMSQQQLEWTRDATLNGMNVLKSLFDYLIGNSLLEKALKEKKESVRLWGKMSSLSKQLQCTDITTLKGVQVSVEYGRLLYTAIYNAWYIMLKSYAAKQYGQMYDFKGIASALDAYDAVFKALEDLKNNEPLCASLFTKTELDKSISECRDYFTEKQKEFGKNSK